MGSYGLFAAPDIVMLASVCVLRRGCSAAEADHRRQAVVEFSTATPSSAQHGWRELGCLLDWSDMYERRRCMRSANAAAPRVPAVGLPARAEPVQTPSLLKHSRPLTENAIWLHLLDVFGYEYAMAAV
jgi:hypothetical protein